MKQTDIALATAVKKALDDLFSRMADAEKAGLSTHIYVPEGSGPEARSQAYVEVSRYYRPGKP